MVKLVMCVCRKKDLSREKFQSYWINHHALLLQKFAKAYNVRRYVQNHTLSTPLNENIRIARGMPRDNEYDGVAELWWESEKDFIDAISSEEGQKLRTVFLDDEAKFLDFERSTAFFTQEHLIVDEMPA